MLDLGRALAPAAHEPDLLDLLSVGVGAKPLASVATCFTAEGVPAWGPPVPDGLRRGALGERLDAAGFEWRLTPVESVREGAGVGEREYVWYELLVDADGESLSAFPDVAPSERSDRRYGEALGYPASAVEWFVADRDAGRSAIDLVREHEDHGRTALTFAASVPYVPAPTPEGARDAVVDGRALVTALGRLDRAGGGDYAESLLTRRIDATLEDHTGTWRAPLHRAMRGTTAGSAGIGDD